MIPGSRRALGLSLCLAVACGSSERAEAQRSAGRVAHAIETVRKAPNLDKAEGLRGLTEVACTGADVCATRDVCRAAYALHVEATRLTQAAKLQVLRGQSLEAAKVLGAAQEKLGEARRQVADCTEREGSLRRRYRL